MFFSLLKEALKNCSGNLPQDSSPWWVFFPFFEYLYRQKFSEQWQLTQNHPSNSSYQSLISYYFLLVICYPLCWFKISPSYSRKCSGVVCNFVWTFYCGNPGIIFSWLFFWKQHRELFLCNQILILKFSKILENGDVFFCHTSSIFSPLC